MQKGKADLARNSMRKFRRPGAWEIVKYRSKTLEKSGTETNTYFNVLKTKMDLTCFFECQCICK